tara:strand:+ start:3156 stop:4631 length:1476 start_codon:yes stop_codon:yes gene_type:complete
MPKISPFQMTEAQAWAGLTTKNHLGAIYQSQPQMASKLMTRIAQTNFGLDLDSYLDQFSPLYLDTDDDFEWDLIGSAKKNVPLVEARIAGTAITGVSTAGLNFTEFELVFPEQWFSDENVIVGEKNEVYSVQVIADPTPEGNNWVYRVKLITGDPDLFFPYDELTAGKRFSKDWSLVEQTLSKKGGLVNFVSPFKMRNAFSMIRMQHTVPGNMIDRPFATAWRDDQGTVHKTWTQYEDYQFDMQFRQEKNRLLMYAHSNKTSDGKYKNFGKSGHIKKQGAGIRQQMESSNTSYYNTFSIDYLIDILLDLSEGKLPSDKREFVLRTGERGAVQFHKAIENNVQLFTPLYNESRMYKAGGQSGVKMPYGYGGQFIEYMGPQGIKVNLSVDSLYDDRERNKIYHPDGGVAESYRYDILDVGTSDGEPNIRKVYVTGSEDGMGYEPGLRHPFSRGGERNIMAHSTDGYTVHRWSLCGAMVKDPSRTAQIIPSILA